MEKLVSLPRLTMLRGIFYSFSSSFLFPLLFLTNFIRSDSKATDKYVDWGNCKHKNRNEESKNKLNMRLAPRICTVKSSSHPSRRSQHTVLLSEGIRIKSMDGTKFKVHCQVWSNYSGKHNSNVTSDLKTSSPMPTLKNLALLTFPKNKPNSTVNR